MKKTFALVCLLLGSAYGVARSQDSTTAPSISNGIFTEAQAKRGEDVYQATCSQCHGSDLVAVAPEAPSLTGPAFKFDWVGKTVGEQVGVIQMEMPATDPGSLEMQTVADIVAFVLKTNGYPAGERELGSDVKELEKIVIEKLPDVK